MASSSHKIEAEPPHPIPPFVLEAAPPPDVMALVCAWSSGPATPGLLSQPHGFEFSSGRSASSTSPDSVRPKPPLARLAPLPAAAPRPHPPARRKHRRQRTPAASTASPSSASSTPAVPAPCPHPKPWRRLRAKRGFVFYACRRCQLQWSVPSSRATLESKEPQSGDDGLPDEGP
eukprot:EG_transcript_6312